MEELVAEAKNYAVPQRAVRIEVEEMLASYHKLVREVIPEQAEMIIEEVRDRAVQICLVAENSLQGIQTYIQVLIFDNFFDAAEKEIKRQQGEQQL